MDWDAVQAYLEALVPQRTGELAAMEAEGRRSGFPIIGPAAGHFCYLIARMTGARSVFEMGSGYGYSTAWFARAVQENGGGVVHHVVWDEELSRQARAHLDALGYTDIVRFTVGEAVEALEKSEGGFDLIFNDIDKQAYPRSLDVITRKLRPGGTLIVDNMLWHGAVYDDSDKTPATQAIRELSRRIFGDPEWQAAIVPIRDGLLLASRLGPAASKPAADGV